MPTSVPIPPIPPVTATQQALHTSLTNLRLLVEKERTSALISSKRLQTVQVRLASAEHEIARLRRSDAALRNRLRQGNGTVEGDDSLKSERDELGEHLKRHETVTTESDDRNKLFDEVEEYKRQIDSLQREILSLRAKIREGREVPDGERGKNTVANLRKESIVPVTPARIDYDDDQSMESPIPLNQEPENAESLVALQVAQPEATKQFSSTGGEEEGLLAECASTASATLSTGSNKSRDEDATESIFAAQKIAELEASVLSADAELALSKSRVQQLLANFESKDAEFVTLQQQKDELADELARVGALLTTKEQDLQLVLSRETNLRVDVDRLKVCLKERDEQIEHDLKPAFRNLESEMREVMSSLSRTKEELNMCRENSNKAIADLEQAKDALSSRIANTLEALESTQGRLALAESQGAEQEILIAQLKGELEELRPKNQKLESDLRHRVSSLSSLYSSLSVSEKERAQHEQSVNDLKIKNSSFAEEILALKDRLGVAESRATRKDTLLFELEGVVSRLRKKLKASEEKEVEACSDVLKYRKVATELQQTLDHREKAAEEHAAIASSRAEQASATEKNLNTLLANKDYEIQKLQTSARLTEKRFENVVAELHESKNAFTLKEKELADCNAKLQEAKDSLADYKRLLQAREEDIENVLCELNLLREELSDRERSLATQKGLLVDRDAEIIRLRAEVSAKERQIEQLHGQIRGLETESARQKSEIDGLAEERRSLLEKLASSQKEVVDRSSEASQLKVRISSLEEDLAKERGSLAESREYSQKLMGQVRVLEHNIEGNQREITVLESHLEGTNSLLKEYRDNEELLADCRAELRVEQDKVSKLASTVEELSSEVATKTELADSLAGRNRLVEKQNHDLEKQVEEEQAKRSTAEEELELLKKRFSTFEKSVQTKISEHRSKASLMESQLSQNESSRKAESLALEEKTVAVKRLEKELAASTRRGDLLLEEISELRFKLNASQILVSKKESQLQQSVAQVKEAREQCSKLETDIRTYEQSVEEFEAGQADKALKASSCSNADPSLASKLEAKEKAILNLHNWCCFINEKLHAAERLLSDRENDVEETQKTIVKLENRIRQLTSTIASQEVDLKEGNLRYMKETSTLRDEIKVLRKRLDADN